MLPYVCQFDRFTQTTINSCPPEFTVRGANQLAGELSSTSNLWVSERFPPQIHRFTPRDRAKILPTMTSQIVPVEARNA
jgi:hypothetical protein